MNVKKALMVSPVKQAIRGEGTELMITVTRLEDGAYSVSVIMGTSVFLSEIVPDEKAVEQMLWDHLRMLPILFEPMQTRYPASRMRTSAQASPDLPSPQGEQRHVPPCNHKRLLSWLHFLISQLLQGPCLVCRAQDLPPSWLRDREQRLSRRSLKMARKLPSEAYQLAATYQLGTPIKRHMDLGWIIFGSCLVAYFFWGWLACTVAAFTSPGLDPFVVGYREVLFIGVMSINVIALFKTWSHYAYECTDGFVVITRKTRQVKHVLHWNDVLSTHTVGRRHPIYYMTDIYQQTIEVPYYALWKRCEEAVAHHAR